MVWHDNKACAHLTLEVKVFSNITSKWELLKPRFQITNHISALSLKEDNVFEFTPLAAGSRIKNVRWTAKSKIWPHNKELKVDAGPVFHIMFADWFVLDKQKGKQASSPFLWTNFVWCVWSVYIFTVQLLKRGYPRVFLVVMQAGLELLFRPTWICAPSNSKSRG